MSPTVQNTKSLTEGRERLCAAVTCMLHEDWPDCTRIYASLCHTLLLEHGLLVQHFFLWLTIHICLLLRVRIFKLVVRASASSSAPVERHEHWQKKGEKISTRATESPTRSRLLFIFTNRNMGVKRCCSARAAKLKSPK